MSIGTRITAARKYAGLSRAHLAGKIKKSRAIVNAWELNQHTPRLPAFRAMARVCGVRMEWLICGTGPMIRAAVTSEDLEAAS